MTTPTYLPSRRQPKIVLDRGTFTRIEALAESAQRRSPELADRLLAEINRAKIVAAQKLREDVVTIGREVTYRDEVTGQVATVTLVFPEETGTSEGRVSLMTSIGVALIGLAKGANFSWITNDGDEHSLTVLEVRAEQIVE